MSDTEESDRQANLLALIEPYAAMRQEAVDPEDEPPSPVPFAQAS